MAEEQNTGLSGIFQDPNFITGMAVLGANADPNRHWSEGYKDASSILSNMQRSALARAELELRKQKMQQEQAQIEAARERAAQMREALSTAETPEDYARAMMQYGEGGQVSSGAQLMMGLQGGGKTPKDIQMFEYWNSLPEGPQKEAFGRAQGFVQEPGSSPNQTAFERLLPEYERLSAMPSRSPQEEARFKAIATELGMMDPLAERKGEITKEAELANIQFNKNMLAQNLREMQDSKNKLLSQSKKFFASGLPYTLGGSITPQGKEMEGYLDEFLGEIALQALKDLKLTGATLGQVTEKELAMLKADLGAIDPGMGEQAIENQVNSAFANFRKRLINRLDMMEAQGGGAPSQSPQGSSDIDALVNKYRVK